MGFTRMQPRGIGDVFDVAIRLYVGNVGTLIGLAALVIVPLQILTGAVLGVTLHSGDEVPLSSFAVRSNPRLSSDAAASAIAYGVLELAGFIAVALVTAACVHAISEGYHGRPADIGSSMRVAGRRILSVLGMELLYVIGLIVAFICLIVPGIFLYCAWSVAVPAVVLERLGPIRALGRSRRLVKGRWWGTAGVLLLTFMISAVVRGVLQGLFVNLASLPAHPGLTDAVLVVSVASAVATILVLPLQAAVTTVLYYDLSSRHQGVPQDSPPGLVQA